MEMEVFSPAWHRVTGASEGEEQTAPDITQAPLALLFQLLCWLVPGAEQGRKRPHCWLMVVGSAEEEAPNNLLPGQVKTVGSHGGYTMLFRSSTTSHMEDKSFSTHAVLLPESF